MQALKEIVALYHSLKTIKAKAVLIGGHAVSARSVARYTKDLDLLFYVTSDREAETIILFLQGLGYRVKEVFENTFAKRLATVRLLSPSTKSPETVLDLIFTVTGIEAEIVNDATEIEIINGHSILVATIPCLIVMKLIASAEKARKQDIPDIMTMLKFATKSEIKRVDQLIKLVAKRGLRINQNISKLWKKLLADFKGN